MNMKMADYKLIRRKRRPWITSDGKKFRRERDAKIHERTIQKAFWKALDEGRKPKVIPGGYGPYQTEEPEYLPD